MKRLAFVFLWLTVACAGQAINTVTTNPTGNSCNPGDVAIVVGNSSYNGQATLFPCQSGGTYGNPAQYWNLLTNALPEAEVIPFTSTTNPLATPNLGISYYASNTLAVGNGTAGTATGQMASSGFNVIASVDCTQATCATTDHTLFTTGSGSSGYGNAGLYRLDAYAVTTTAATTCDGLINLTWTDDSSTTTTDYTFYAWDGTDAGNNTIANSNSSSPTNATMFWAKPSSVIAYQVVHSGLSCTGFQFSAHLTLTQIR
jgi:hypothetical protein